MSGELDLSWLQKEVCDQISGWVMLWEQNVELQNLVSGSTGRLQVWSNQHNAVYLKSKWEVLGVFVSYFNLVPPYSAPENTSCRHSILSVEFFQLLDLIMIVPASGFVFAFLKFILIKNMGVVGWGWGSCWFLPNQNMKLYLLIWEWWAVPFLELVTSTHRLILRFSLRFPLLSWNHCNLQRPGASAKFLKLRWAYWCPCLSTVYCFHGTC